MPKVKLHTLYSHPERGSHQPGAVIDVDHEEARDLVAGNYASHHTDEAAVAPALPERKPARETAARRAPKNAAKK